MADDVLDLPDGLELTRSTPDFDEQSVPAGLLATHRVADDVWGRLVVTRGCLRFVFEDAVPASAGRTIVAGEHQVIPPARAHHIELIGPVGFHVDFHR